MDGQVTDLGVATSCNRRCAMYTFCILAGIILLSGCTTVGHENLTSSDVSYHSNATNSVQQKEYDAAIDNYSKLPEYIR